MQMRNIRTFKYSGLCSLFLLFLFHHCSQKDTSTSTETPPAEFYTADDFKSVEKIDTHVHLREVGDTIFIQQAQEDNFRLLTISVYTANSLPVEEQEKAALQFVNAYPDQMAYATAFSIEHWNSDDWQEKTLAYLKSSFSRGAIAVKVWKT
jgi:hypothetical protein